MLNDFGFFIFVGVLSVSFGFNVRDDVPWFKDRERITDRFLVGMINGRNALCNGTQNHKREEGVCLSHRECSTEKGVRINGCSFLGTCCLIEKTCSETVSAKLSYFVPPKVFLPDCPLTVKPINKDVCQIRLDFEKFSIAGPTESNDASNTKKSFQCHHDAFTITAPSGNLGFVHLCGENAKQHMYIPVHSQGNVILRFQLQPERTGLDFVDEMPDWRIRIHQLECSRSHSVDLNNIQSSLSAMHHSHKHKKPGYNSDYRLMAPSGCLQYLPERTGTYESFNYNSGRGPYIGKMSYAICFKRTPDICGIRHTAEFFVMNYNVDSYSNLECHPSSPASEEVSQDYIQIPEGMTDEQHMGFFCDRQLRNSTPVTAIVPGPLFVGVKTDAFRSHGDRLELGFKIHYQLINDGCN